MSGLERGARASGRKKTVLEMVRRLALGLPLLCSVWCPPRVAQLDGAARLMTHQPASPLARRIIVGVNDWP